MELGIRGAFGFADHESGEKWDSDTDSHFSCIINLLLIHFLNLLSFINVIN